MSNACKIEELSQLKIKESPTLMDLYTEMNRLKLENEILKANNYELEMVNEQLRNDVELLHNIAQNQIELEILKNDKNNQGGWTEEETLLLTSVYAEMDKDYKF